MRAPLLSSCRRLSELVLNAEVERVVLGRPCVGGPLSRHDVKRLESPRNTVPVSNAAPQPDLVQNRLIKLQKCLAVRREIDRAWRSGLWTVQRIGDLEPI